MKEAHDLIKAIDDHLAEDEKMLTAVQQQADAVHGAFADLMTRLRLEIDAASGTSGAHHLRG